MDIVKILETRFPAVYRLLARVYQKTPMYDRALAKVLEQRAQREQGLLGKLFDGDFTVRQGPFAGMHYLPNACGSMILPKILGSYECSLAPWILEVQQKDYGTLIDVGCAEGYYAVGLARDPKVRKIFAYDLNPEARLSTSKLAELNGVAERVVVKEHCDWQELSRQVRGRTFVLCDIEGAELELLDPEKCKELKQCDLIVELHDCFIPGITEELTRRFEPTHNIEIVQERPRRADDYPLLRGLPEEEQAFILDEHRPPDMKWMRMKTKNF